MRGQWRQGLVVVVDCICSSGGEKTRIMQIGQLLLVVGGKTCLSLRKGKEVASVQDMVPVVEEHWHWVKLLEEVISLASCEE
ncbi:hypothetical protein SLA2020_325320 [Shorea laevis]